jgi:hypothetical protein
MLTQLDCYIALRVNAIETAKAKSIRDLKRLAELYDHKLLILVELFNLSQKETVNENTISLSK